MCGIAGIINFNETSVDEKQLRTMLSAIKHRGPDDEGVYLGDTVGFGFVRLSIIDLSPAGHQPMFSDDNRYVIVFNGEIFNYIELKKELQALGVVFKTHTDTEVLLNAYITWGKDCLDKLNGMWAFAILDHHENIVFASRDRYGIKPFYFYKDNDRFVFASEIPPILNVLKQKPRANSAAIFDYLVFNRTDQNEETFFEGITKLKHGECVTIGKNEATIERWYDLKKNLKVPFKSPEEFKEALLDSVNIRLRSDVPVGICFSGGLDSSAILSILLKENNRHDVNTFSAIYKAGDKGDESSFMNLYKDEVKNMHFIKPSAESLFEDMHDLVHFHAEPIPDTSPYAQYKVMQLVHKHVTVTLDGQGADEQLGGYHYFFGLYYKELFKKLKWLKLIKEIFYYRKNHKSNFALKTFVYFMLPSALRKKLKVREKGYVHEDFYRNNNTGSTTANTIYNSESLHDALLDHFEYKMEHLLKWEDRNSMRFSIEARVPFLDHRIVEKTIPLHAEQIIQDGTTKFIFRESMKGLLPEAIRMRQDKVGFATPESEWFRKDFFKAFILELLDSPSFKQRKIIDVEKAKELYEKHLEKEIDIAREIWKWINLELWYRKYID